MNAHKMWAIGAATIVGGAALFASDAFLTATSPASFTTQAEARIGRPLTPFSVAGVARRTTRRAVVAGAVTAGALGYGYYGSSYPYGSGASYGYSYPYGWGGTSYGYGYPYGYGGSYGFGGSTYGYNYPYGYNFPSASYAYARPLGWRFGRWW
jgi:hypothetical protein